MSGYLSTRCHTGEGEGCSSLLTTQCLGEGRHRDRESQQQRNLSDVPGQHIAVGQSHLRGKIVEEIEKDPFWSWSVTLFFVCLAARVECKLAPVIIVVLQMGEDGRPGVGVDIGFGNEHIGEAAGSIDLVQFFIHFGTGRASDQS
jgi:hypothetical protein